CPCVSFVVMIDVTQEKTLPASVDNQTNIAANAHGPEVRILGLVELMKLQSRLGGIELQIKRRSLCSLLLIRGQTSEAVGEGIRDEEFHVEIPYLKWGR